MEGCSNARRKRVEGQSLGIRPGAELIALRGRDTPVRDKYKMHVVAGWYLVSLEESLSGAAKTSLFIATSSSWSSDVEIVYTQAAIGSVDLIIIFTSQCVAVCGMVYALFFANPLGWA